MGSHRGASFWARIKLAAQEVTCALEELQPGLGWFVVSGHCRTSHPICSSKEDPSWVMSGAITQLRPELLEHTVTAMAMSDSKYWVVADLPATSEFLHAVALYEPAPSAHFSLPSSSCLVSSPEPFSISFPFPLPCSLSITLSLSIVLSLSLSLCYSSSLYCSLFLSPSLYFSNHFSVPLICPARPFSLPAH